MRTPLYDVNARRKTAGFALNTDPVIGVVPSRHLRQCVGSVARCRDDILRAPDWLLFGI
jgi:hypothetical protein